jgi:hypothetical protein
MSSGQPDKKLAQISIWRYEQRFTVKSLKAPEFIADSCPPGES